MADDLSLKALGDAANEALPWIGRAAKVLQAYRLKRMHTWWKRFAQRDHVDTQDVEDEICSAIAGGDDRVMQAIMEGCRAATNSYDPVALPAIALIGRSYIRGEVPAWFQRSSLAYLSGLSAEEVGQLRDFVNAAKNAIGSAEPNLVGVWPQETGTSIDWRDAADETQRTTLDTGFPYPTHFGGELKRHGLAHPAFTFHGAMSPAGLRIEYRVLRWLAEALPPVHDT